MEQISSFLEIHQKPDAILSAINEKQHDGSCQWLTTDEAFREWVDGSGGLVRAVSCQERGPRIVNPRLLWLTGRPGTGKSVASSHVVRHLEACNLNCSFYFFRHDDRAGSTLSALLRSLSFQTAESNSDVRHAIVSMIEDGARIDPSDYRLLWNKLFIDCIFKLESLKPQFWVIDALDECSSDGMPALVTLLSKLDPGVPLRVFLTSRPSVRLGRLLAREKLPFAELRTGQTGSLHDIERFLDAKCSRIQGTKSYRGLVPELLSRSNGIFLWASLMVDKLNDIDNMEDMAEALLGFPSEMDGLYSRVAESILSSPSRDLAICVLKWIICSPRPMTMGELAGALKTDINRTLMASPDQLEAITGGLVFVDEELRLHLMHDTTSSFLTRQRDGLWIDRPSAHSRIAEICLEILCGGDFTPPKSPRSAASALRKTTSPLASYAAANFGYHLLHSSLASDTSLVLLDKFLRSNVLSWIEKLSRSGDILILRQTIHWLKAFLARRARRDQTVSAEVQAAAAWLKDIHHIVTSFHSCLIASPISIHFLVPHLCPPSSLARQLFAKPTTRLRITGVREEKWDDRMACYLFSETPTSVACCERLLAFGLRNGEIWVQHAAGFGTFEPLGPLVHGSKVRLLKFDSSNSFLASCSARKLMLWDVRQSEGASFPCRWARDLDFTPDQVLFSKDGELLTLADPREKTLTAFRVADGSQGKTVRLCTSSDSELLDIDQPMASQLDPAQIRVDPHNQLAVMTHRNASVSVWDLSAGGKIGYFEKEGGYDGSRPLLPVLDVVFNPIPELELLAISYQDGDVVVCNPWALEEVAKYHLRFSLDILACTPDGRVLAGAARDSSINLFLFETLQLLYRVQSPNERFWTSGLAFSSDNLRLFEIRGPCCNVWEPLALASHSLYDVSSELQAEEFVLEESVASRTCSFHWESIAAIQPTERNLIFVGRNDGIIDILAESTGNSIKKLQLHGSRTPIKHMDWNESKNILLSVDRSCHCIVTRLSFDNEDGAPHASVLLDHRDRSVTTQALLSPDASKVLILSSEALKVVMIDEGSVKLEIISPTSGFKFCATHPSDSSLLMVFGGTHIHLFDWNSLDRLSTAEGIPIVGPEAPLPDLNGSWAVSSGSTRPAYLVHRLTSHAAGFAAVDLAQVTRETREVELRVHTFDTLRVQAMVGVCRSTLYFIDMEGWVCSIDVRNVPQVGHYLRHFFMPPSWQTGRRPIVQLISETALAFARTEQLIVVDGFLDFEEKVSLEDPGAALALRPANAA